MTQSDFTNPEPLTASDGSLVSSLSAELVTELGRLPVAEPRGRFEARHNFDKLALLFDESLGGGSTSVHLPSSSSVRLRMPSGAVAAQAAIRQSWEYIPYQPGRPQVFMNTGTFGTPVAGAQKSIGCFDANDGLFFRQNGASGIEVVRRTSTSGAPVDEVKTQAQWNIDRLDGSGRSKIVVDFTKLQLYVISFVWLGAARARLGVEVNGQVVWCHEFVDKFAVPYMKTAVLPIRYEIRTTGTLSADADLIHVCSAVFSEGGADAAGFPGSIDTHSLVGAPIGVSSGVRVPLMSIRLKAAYNRATILPKSFDILNSSNQSFLFEILLGGTLQGAPVVASATDAAEVLRGATGLVGGRRIKVGLAASAARIGTTEIPGRLAVASSIAGVPQLVHLVVTPFGNSTFDAALNWLEVY